MWKKVKRLVYSTTKRATKACKILIPFIFCSLEIYKIEEQPFQKRNLTRQSQNYELLSILGMNNVIHEHIAGTKSNQNVLLQKVTVCLDFLLEVGTDWNYPLCLPLLIPERQGWFKEWESHHQNPEELFKVRGRKMWNLHVYGLRGPTNLSYNNSWVNARPDKNFIVAC